MRRWNRLPEVVRDAVGSVPIILIFVVGQQGFGEGQSLIRAVAVVAVIAVSVTFRRRWPLGSYVAGLATVVAAQTGLELLAVLSYTVVVHRPRVRPTAVAGASALACIVGYLQYWPAFVLADVAGDLAIIAVVSVLPVLLGRAVRQYRETAAELAARNAELVRLREQEARHAVQTERLRIARELHDVVAHHISAMTVRARAGRHVADTDSAAATEALAYIADAGTATLAAMRTFVATLRDHGDETTGGDGLAPQPGLADLDALLESCRGAGLVVHADIGPPPPVTPALGLNTYRIVQEALTNVIRHGAAERAWVRIWYTEDTVHIEVDDNGRGSDSAGRPAGHGLVGMAERAALHDGASELGPSPRGGCRLKAALRLDDAHSAHLEGVQLPGSSA